MSLHRNDFLVTGHQADLARHAADIRLARSAAAASRQTSERRVGRLHAKLTGLVAAMRPVRSAASDAVKLPGGPVAGQSSMASGVSRS